MAAPPRTAQVGCLGRLPIRQRCATCPGAMCPAAPSTASTDKSGSSRRRPRPASPAPRDGNWDSAPVLDQPCSPTRGHHAEPSRSLTGSTALIASTPTPAPTSSRANVENDPSRGDGHPQLAPRRLALRRALADPARQRSRTSPRTSCDERVVSDRAVADGEAFDEAILDGRQVRDGAGYGAEERAGPAQQCCADELVLGRVAAVDGGPVNSASAASRLAVVESPRAARTRRRVRGRSARARASLPRPRTPGGVVVQVGSARYRPVVIRLASRGVRLPWSAPSRPPRAG